MLCIFVCLLVDGFSHGIPLSLKLKSARSSQIGRRTPRSQAQRSNTQAAQPQRGPKPLQHFAH